jgi:predicted phosphodiesterase
MHKRILVIGDLHFPYQHKSALNFLRKIKEKYSPDLVISIGDEVDGHAISYHEKSVKLDSAGVEYIKAKKCIKELEKIFPKLKILESNQGSLHLRKAQTAGIPEDYIKGYNDIWDVGEGWSWHYELIEKMSNGEELYLHHARSSSALKASQQLCMNVVFGHHHNKQSIEYWSSGYQTKFGAFTGCLVDNDSLAMAYGKIHLKKPLLGSLLILNGKPVIIRMNVNKAGIWDGKI